MAFRGTNQAVAPAAETNERPTGYINIYLPRKGTDVRMKLGQGVRLHLSKADEAAIINAYKSGAMTDEKLASKLIVEFRLAEQSPSTGVDLD